MPKSRRAPEPPPITLENPQDLALTIHPMIQKDVCVALHERAEQLAYEEAKAQFDAKPGIPPLPMPPRDPKLRPEAVQRITLVMNASYAVCEPGQPPMHYEADAEALIEEYLAKMRDLHKRMKDAEASKASSSRAYDEAKARFREYFDHGP